ncbi:hypothetical protein T484DRAFT_1814527, partial [Baffinella frigidus]
YLERRLTGLGDINEFVEALASRSENKEVMADDDSGPAWAVPDYMCEWLMSNKILDGIFLSNQHTEVLRRSNKLLLFLAANGHVGE